MNLETEPRWKVVIVAKNKYIQMVDTWESDGFESYREAEAYLDYDWNPIGNWELARENTRIKRMN